MKKQLMALTLAAAMAAGLMTAPAVKADDPIKLTVWGSENDQEYLAERIEAFKAAYPDQQFDIQIGVESESTAKDTVLTDIEAAADVFAFADDQLADLVSDIGVHAWKIFCPVLYSR